VSTTRAEKHGHGALVPLDEARAYVVARCAPLAGRDVPIGDAAGLVLAAAVVADHDVPPFANSAMDGYAVRARETVGAPCRLVERGTLMAGDAPTIDVGPGEAVRIMTGAPMPPGADAVCKVEDTEPGGDGTVVVERPVAVGENVRDAGDDIAAGSEVFAPGTALGPAAIGVVASLGIDSVRVRPRPRVAVVATGDELVADPGPLAPGKIRDANRPALLARLATDGFDAVDLGQVGDDPRALAAVLERAGGRADAVVVTGGVSVGDRDVARVVLADRCHDMRWMQVAIKPAKPFAFGVLATTGAPVFGLPGNPVSALVSYELFARPGLRRLAGSATTDRPRLAATAEAPLVRRPDGKLHLLRAVARVRADGTLGVRPAGGQGSHQLRVMAAANALALVPDGDGIAEGGAVEVVVLDPFGPVAEDRAWTS
jgi:molybdopterin molybdotransferase